MYSYLAGIEILPLIFLFLNFAFSLSFFFPFQRITIPEIKRHPWFLKDLPTELVEVERNNNQNPISYEPTQSIEEITRIVQKARRPAKVTSHLALFGWHFDPEEQEDSESDIDPDDPEAEVDIQII